MHQGLFWMSKIIASYRLNTVDPFVNLQKDSDALNLYRLLVLHTNRELTDYDDQIQDQQFKLNYILNLIEQLIEQSIDENTNDVVIKNFIFNLRKFMEHMFSEFGVFTTQYLDLYMNSLSFVPQGGLNDQE